MAPISVEFLKPYSPRENESFNDLKTRVKNLIANKLSSNKNKE